MSTLQIFLDLQAVHDNLATIQRDLTDFPPEMSKLETELKAIGRRIDAAEKVRSEAVNTLASLSMNLEQSEKLEAAARAAVKSATQKVQFAAAMRELDERERQKASIVRPMKEAETRQANSEKELETLKAHQAELQSQFDGLHEIFLSEHENQVAARKLLDEQRSGLEKQLEAAELTRFNKLLTVRHGKAVMAVENGTCTGCRTKLRAPLLSKLRECSSLACENCQRIIYLPAHS